MATLAGVWKLSTSTSLRSAARRAAADASLPKRIRFVVETERANFEAGRCEVPFREQCGGRYELHDEGDRRAAFSVACPPRAGVAAGADEWSFDGLFDGERIAGTISDADGAAVGDFLCTRLFSFWGTPKPKAGG